MEQTNISSTEKPLTNFDNLTVSLTGDKRFDFFSYANTQFPVEEKQVNVTLDVLGGGFLASWGMTSNNNLVISRVNTTNSQSSAAGYPESDVALYVAEMVISTDNSPDETKNTLGKKYADKLVALENKIGKKQFGNLSLSQQIFMANTFGAINLGGDVNIQSLYKNIQDE